MAGRFRPAHRARDRLRTPGSGACNAAPAA